MAGADGDAVDARPAPGCPPRDAVKSSEPAEEPALTTTRSCSASARTPRLRIVLEVVGHAAQAGDERSPPPRPSRPAPASCTRRCRPVAGAPGCREADQLGAGGEDGDARPAVDRHGRVAAAGDRPQILRPQAVVGGQHQLAWPPCPRPSAARSARAGVAAMISMASPAGGRDELRVLDLDHGVGGGRQRVARVHVDRPATPTASRERLRLGGAAGLLGAHGVAVHGRGVVVGRRDARPDWRGRHPPQAGGHG